MSFDYFYGQQSDLFTFYRVPKVLFTNERFWNISADAKMLYGILLDRMSLSAKNGWIDKNGRVYIIFTIDEAKMALNCAEQKATLAYPIFRAENRENFERMLSQDERNHAVRVDAQTEEKPVTEDFLGKTEPRDYTPEYQLLDRLRMDCEYFLGAGQHSEKHLWAGNRHAQIAKMRELYEMIPDKPEWLTPEMINSYEERMAPRYLVAAYHHFENGFDDKLDYYTLEEAEKAAQGYVDGTMEDDGFKYDGAAVYDQQEHKCIRIYGD